MTARLLASKCSQTVEAVADVGNHCTHTSVKVYDGYAYDDCSHLSWFSAKIHSNNCSLYDCRVNHHYSFVCVFCENLSKKNCWYNLWNLVVILVIPLVLSIHVFVEFLFIIFYVACLSLILLNAYLCSHMLVLDKTCK